MKPIRMSHRTSSLCEALPLTATTAANPNPIAFALAVLFPTPLSGLLTQPTTTEVVISTVGGAFAAAVEKLASLPIPCQVPGEIC
jgi:hypothetical protein